MATNSNAPQSAQQSSTGKTNRVVITGIDVPFLDWVTLLIKITIAAIPAYFLIAIVGAVMLVVFSLFGVGIGALVK